jgi:uncharacterized Ntn-hydrolase superfamily protein
MSAAYDLTGIMLSILAHDPASQTLGIALASSTLAIGARCQHLAPGRAVVASQGFTNLRVGALALDLIERGLTGREVIGALQQHDRWMEYRQIAIVPADGPVEVHTGEHTTGWAGHVTAPGFACLGNGLPDGAVLQAMHACFDQHAGQTLEQRLLASLEQGRRVLGPAAWLVSSALRVGGPAGAAPLDLRVDLAREPPAAGGCAVADLRLLCDTYRPLALVYEARSHAPHRAEAAS